MSNDSPEIDPDTGRRLCQQCHRRPVPESLGTKPRMYCGRNCRQRAYETRKQTRVTDAAVGAALAAVATDERPAKSRDERAESGAKSRDLAERPARPAAVEDHVQEALPIPAAPAEPKAIPFKKKPTPQPRRSIDAFKGLHGRG
ncbi:hypothetical protein [Streptomyces sp. NPDC059122]|uniref:hypothetical protein n=1 Tax=Streptomyces sp. NPDC059122 TaxID=3346732 RepID=UPI00368DE2A4